MSSTCWRRRRSTCTKRCGCRITRRSSATSPRSSRTRASAISSKRRTWSCARSRTRGSSFSAKANCANTSSAWSTSTTSRSTCCCRASAPTSSGCIKGFDLFAMSSVTEGLGTSLLDAMACSKPIVATRTGGIPEMVEDGVNGLLVAPATRRRWPARSCGCSPTSRTRRQMGERAASRRVSERFTVSGWWSETAAGLRARRGRGAHAPLSGHWASPRATFRSRRRSSCPGGTSRSRTSPDRSASRRRSDVVMSRAIGQPGLA